MILDSQEQRANLLRCIEVTASTMRVDASEKSLLQHAALVKLRQEVESAEIALAKPEDSLAT